MILRTLPLVITLATLEQDEKIRQNAERIQDMLGAVGVDRADPLTQRSTGSITLQNKEMLDINEQEIR